LTPGKERKKERKSNRVRRKPRAEIERGRARELVKRAEEEKRRGALTVLDLMSQLFCFVHGLLDARLIHKALSSLADRRRRCLLLLLLMLLGARHWNEGLWENQGKKREREEKKEKKRRSTMSHSTPKTIDKAQENARQRWLSSRERRPTLGRREEQTRSSREKEEKFGKNQIRQIVSRTQE
jgi:hypothetical protein